MSGDLALAMLLFLAQIQSWHLVAAGVAGAALCIGLRRTIVLALIGATLCGAVARAGIVDMWRSRGAPDRIVIVAARTVDASGGDGDVDWKFEDPQDG
jgi:hypothetical protein